ncbi:hypothetical protein OU994_23440 [Pseudoduganella sp. SL102]|uniref:T6SS effector BTH_I2691 family protein n=1 Tax=Pseudoduganella sp. SL102 TaxID=2995154 RepID=UPI00248B843B|nr:T6SS effector BTH_I2691 family protein [Pseudoduganella sp. SL102]WBS01227.1 hypothetical protein OU994_23440 [Pseudoduganella sp. SL102]
MINKKDCKFCDKKGLLWLPLRYSAVVADKPGDLASLPALGGTLGKGVTDLALTEAKYGVRLLRPGYLYVLIERQGIKYWTAYQVLQDAFLYQFEPEQPPQVTPEFSCDRSVCGVNASMVAIPNAREVTRIWSLFTPSAMTKAKLAEYKGNADAYAADGKMQTFNPAGWLDGTTDQPHSLLAPELFKKVVEYLLFAKGGAALTDPLGVAMEKQLFPASRDAYAGAPPNAKGEYYGRLGSLFNYIKKSGFATLVLWDHIGVTQELNDFRNAPLEGVQNYLGATDQYGATNEHRLQVYEAIEEIRTGFEQGIVQSTKSFIDQHQHGSDQYFQRQRNVARTLRAQGRIADAEAVEKSVDESLKARAVNYRKAIEEGKVNGAEKWRSKYESRLDTNEMKAFRDKLNSHTTAAFEKANKRAPDHLKWFLAERLLDAFDAYDQKNQSSGFDFAMESAVCSFGLSGCRAGEAKIDEWVQAKVIDRKNLYMRGYYQNQRELIDAARQAYKDIQVEATKVTAASEITAATMIKATKGLVSAFKSTDSAFDEWVRNQKKATDSPFIRDWHKPKHASKALGQKYGIELILFHKVTEITRTVFRKGLGTSVDKVLVARLSGILYARLGSVAEKLRYDDLMLAIDKSKLADGYKGRSAERNAELARRRVQGKAAAAIPKELAPSLGDLVADAQEKNKANIRLDELVGNNNPPTNNYHHVRIGAVLACIEMIGLGEKLSHNKWDSDSLMGIAGSAMAVGSVVLDMFYAGAKSIREIEPYKSISAINKSADIVRGGFKLGAGVLSAGASFFGAILDWGKMDKEKDPVMRTIYFLRALTGTASVFMTLIAAFSYLEPLLNHVSKRYAENQLRYKMLEATASLAGKAALRVRLLVYIARLNWFGLALTAVEIGYLLLKDDDLQNWCEKSVFRRQKKTTGWLGETSINENFANATAELEELDKASRAIAAGG